jgi:hypothetical protein
MYVRIGHTDKKQFWNLIRTLSIYIDLDARLHEQDGALAFG